MNKLLQWKWYLVVAAAYLIVVILKFEVLAEILKLQLLPMVFWQHYRTRGKVHRISWIIFICYYIGDIIWPIKTEQLYPYMLFFFGMGHLVFIYIAYKCIKDVSLKKLLFSFLPFIALWFVYFLFSIKDIFGAKMGSLYPAIMIYASLVILFFFLALVKFFNDERKVYLFSVIMAIALTFGDIMHGFYTFVSPLFIFLFSHAFATTVQYFFMLRFFNEFDYREITSAKTEQNS